MISGLACVSGPCLLTFRGRRALQARRVGHCRVHDGVDFYHKERILK